MNASLPPETSSPAEDEISSSNAFFEFVVPGVFLNGIGLLGLLGNLISVVVLSRPQMRSSINCILIGLASFDSILIITSILMFGLPAVHAFNSEFFSYYFLRVFPYITPCIYPVGMIAQTGSAYLTLCVTLERYVAVCLPLQARRICTYRRACYYVAAIGLFATLYNLPRFWEVTWSHVYYPQINANITEVIPTDLRSDDTYISVYITWMYLVVMYIIPFSSLAVFNLLIYCEVRFILPLHLSLSTALCGTQVRRANSERVRLTRLQQKEISLATMLMVVVFVFFVCNVLALVVNILEVMSINITALNNVSNMLVTVNSSVNFIIYCIFGEKFKRIFFRIFCPASIKNNRRMRFLSRYPIDRGAAQALAVGAAGAIDVVGGVGGGGRGGGDDRAVPQHGSNSGDHNNHAVCATAAILRSMASSSSSTESSCSSAASVRGRRRLMPLVMMASEMVPLTSETRFGGDSNDGNDGGNGDGVSRSKRRNHYDHGHGRNNCNNNNNNNGRTAFRPPTPKENGTWYYAAGESDDLPFETESTRLTSTTSTSSGKKTVLQVVRPLIHSHSQGDNNRAVANVNSNSNNPAQPQKSDITITVNIRTCGSSTSVSSASGQRLFTVDVSNGNGCGIETEAEAEESDAQHQEQPELDQINADCDSLSAERRADTHCPCGRLKRESTPMQARELSRSQAHKAEAGSNSDDLVSGDASPEGRGLVEDAERGGQLQ